MTSHEEWFMNMRKPKRRAVVETGGDSTHTTEHIGDVPFNNNGDNSYITDVLHVPTITKNLVSVGQIVEQGMTVQISLDGCFIEDKGRIVVRGRRESRMLTLDTSKVSTMLYAKGLKHESDIEL